MDLERIIETLLSPDTAAIQEATSHLEEAFKKPETIDLLCGIMANHKAVEIRQYAAVLLKKRLIKLRNYQQVSAQTKKNIKDHMLTTMFNEQENSVRGNMAQFFGCILRHESRSQDNWVHEVIQYVLQQCNSSEPKISETGSFILAKLADSAPEPFVQNFAKVGELFQVALLAAENPNSGFNVSSTIMYNILTAMGALVPQILGCTEVEKIYQAAIPHLVNVINKYAADSLMGHFTIALEVLQNMSECTPLLLNPHVRLLMEFTLAVSANSNYDAEIRISALTYVCFLVKEKKKNLVKLKLIEPITSVVFNIMASEPESDDADEFFIESEEDTPLAAATLVMDTLAVNMPPEKFIVPLLALLEPALQNAGDELRRRAAYIALATIAEGCRDAICNKYIEPMLTILKQGLSDPVLSVRSAALFAVGQFSEQLQPEIAEYGHEVLPLLLKYMQDILQMHQTGQDLEAKHAERVFYALEAFCKSMEDALAPFMENLMSIVMLLLDSNYPKRLQILAMSLAESAADAYKESLLPWFQPLIEKLRPLLVLEYKDDLDGVRAQAIETLAAVAKNIGQQFRPFAAETMQQCVQWMEANDDPDVRRASLNLCGALASIVGEELAPLLPTILNHIERSMDEGTDLPPELVSAANQGAGDAGKDDNVDDDDDDDEIDLDNSSDDDSDLEDQFFGENPYLQAKGQAVMTIKDLAEFCPQALMPYNKVLYESLFKVIEHPYVDIRKSSIVAACTLAVKWFEKDPSVEAKQAVHAIILKLLNIIRKDNDPEVVIESLEALCDLISDLEGNALPTKELQNSIALCIKDGLSYKFMCQFSGESGDDESEEEDDSESDKIVIEGAANLLTALCKAVPSQEFPAYFKSLEPLVQKHIGSSTASDLQSTRGYLIGVLAECYPTLGPNVAPYFSKHLNLLTRAAKERNAKTRQNAIYGLGELARAAGEISYNSFPAILATLSDAVANEKKRVIVDNVCSALARLILTNVSLVPMDQVFPALMQKLPIVDDDIESKVVFECLEMLYDRMPESMQSHVAAVVAVIIQTIGKKQCEQNLVNSGIQLLQKIRAIYPAESQQALSNPTLVTFLTQAQENAGGQF